MRAGRTGLSVRPPGARPCLPPAQPTSRCYTGLRSHGNAGCVSLCSTFKRHRWGFDRAHSAPMWRVGTLTTYMPTAREQGEDLTAGAGKAESIAGPLFSDLGVAEPI